MNKPNLDRLITRFGTTEAHMRIMQCRYRAQSHIALDRLHALHAAIYEIQDRSVG